MSYVIFDLDSGEITSITNIQPKESINYIEDDSPDVIDMLIGKETPKMFIVAYDEQVKEYKLNKRIEFEAEKLVIDDLIYQIPTDIESNITIIQDIPNTCWKFLISEELEVELRSKFINLKSILHFSITEQNNPNILYKTILVDLEQLVKNHYLVFDFTAEFEKEDIPLSVFTVNRFDSYSYKRISNE
jgi:hypothetical protein